MRIGLKAKSRKRFGYTPDWLKVTLPEGDLVFDIQGEISYSPDDFNCLVKGDLIPWTIWKDGEETDISEKTEVLDKIYQNLDSIFSKATDFEVGIYPISEYPDLTEDVLGKGFGFIEYLSSENREIKSVNFQFTTELN